MDLPTLVSRRQVSAETLFSDHGRYHSMNSEQRSIAEIILELIAPALIMVLVGSFVMFLVEVFYQGTYTTLSLIHI